MAHKGWRVAKPQHNQSSLDSTNQLFLYVLLQCLSILYLDSTYRASLYIYNAYLFYT